MKTMYKLKSLIASSSLITLMACGSAAGTSTGSTPAFPSQLSVASPLALSSGTQGASLTRFATTSGGFTSAFSASTDDIAAILNGTSAAACTFDPSLFLAIETDAPCYGPALDYQDHPDGGGTTDGSLPTGDLGMWSDTNTADDGTVSACSAAELNARMEGASTRSQAALMSVASMVCALTNSTPPQSLPVNDTVDLYDEMEALGITDTTFSTTPNAVSISHSNTTGADVYTYALSFTYAGNNIVVEMEHEAGGSSADYHGRLSYLVNTTMTGGNCPDPEVTSNNSLLYEANAGNLNMEVRSAQYCGHDSDGRVDGIPDPTKKYDPASELKGWGNNYNIFLADFDQTTLEGNFAYMWQAGPDDGHARIFNLFVEPNADDTDPAGDDSGDTDLTGKAFFGFGEDIEDTDGSIEGFICNWAGPGASHTLTEDAQYQFVTMDYSTGSIEADISMIDYAPVNGCDYDYTGTETFAFDTDNDDDLTDEDPTVDVTESMLDAVDGSDADSDATIEEAIAVGGFTLPTAPANL